MMDKREYDAMWAAAFQAVKLDHARRKGQYTRSLKLRRAVKQVLVIADYVAKYGTENPLK